VLALSAKALEIAYARDEDHDEASEALLLGRHLRFEHGHRMRDLLLGHDAGPRINNQQGL
jgi:hypothetical protein